jgi:hypothetical protein
MKFSILSAVPALFFSSLVSAQLSGDVGLSNTRASKAAIKVCNILNYGGVASKTTDNGPAIASAWAAGKSGREGKPSTRMLFFLLTRCSLYPCWKLSACDLGPSYWGESSFHKSGWYNLPYWVSVEILWKRHLLTVA